ncbi:MAG: hypothetical protein WC208_09255 [Gallionella sp.]|jgi:hypothetical protein
MKTVLLISPSGTRYFQRVNGVWQLIEKPAPTDKLWVIANLPEETLEAFNFPLLFGRDRSNFLERRLVAAFPRSQYRAAAIISGNWFKPGTAVLTGLTSAEAVTSRLDKLSIPIAGVWGISTLLTLMARRLAINNVLLAIPSEHYLRILVIREGIPVLTRCVRRYSEDNSSDNNSDANEILRTRQHLENRRMFEHDAMPPILYMGDATSVSPHLDLAGLTLLPLPDALLAKADAAYLHPLFEQVISSPHGQLAPLQLRARHLAENVRQASYAGIALSLLAVVLFGQEDFRALIDLQGHEKTLNTNLQQTIRERDLLAARISATGTDPALLRQATTFAALKMDAAPTPESILRFTAAAIADLPQVRIKSLTFRFPKQGERYCQGQSVIPLIGGSNPSDSDSAAVAQHFTELQFSILLTENMTPAAQIEINKRISAALKARDGIQLMQDPAVLSLINTLKGGFGMETTQTDNLWCMSIPWKTTPPNLEKPLSANGSGRAIAPVVNLPEQVRSQSDKAPANNSLRELRVKGLP